MEDNRDTLTTPPVASWELDDMMDMHMDVEATFASILADAETLPPAPKSAWAGQKLAAVVEHRNRRGNITFRCRFDGLGGPEGMWVPLNELLLEGEHKEGVASYLRAVRAKPNSKSWTALKKVDPRVEEIANN